MRKEMNSLNCVNHPEKEQFSTCSLCGNSFCQECQVTLGEQNYCKKCLRDKVGNGEEKVSCKPLPAYEKKSKLWAFIFSLIPGVGYLYLGLMNRGFQTMMLFFGTIFLTSFIGFEDIMALVAPVVVFYSIFDTQQLAKDINAGNPVDDKQFFDLQKIPFTQSWIGYSLIIVGGLAILHNVIPYFPFWMRLRQLLPPLLIMGLGVAILYRNTKKSG